MKINMCGFFLNLVSEVNEFEDKFYKS